LEPEERSLPGSGETTGGREGGWDGLYKRAPQDRRGGNGVSIEIPAMTDEEYLWEPVPNCWSWLSP
jgi:hypothetical protein